MQDNRLDLIVEIERLQPERPRPGRLALAVTVAIAAAAIAALWHFDTVWPLHAAAVAYAVWLFIR